MADALISFVVEQLGSYVKKEVNLVVEVREEVRNLTDTLELLQGLIADAERKQFKDSAVKVWLEKLRDVIYAADDVLDEWRTKTLLSQAREGDADVASSSSSSSTRKKVKVLSYFLTSCYCFKRVSVRYDISHQIKEIRHRIDVIAAQREQFGLVVSENHDEWERRSSPNNLTTSAVDVSGIKGRQRDIKAVSDMLLGASSCQGNVPVQVISIVGMGGMGKTTLAGLVYKEKEVVAAFEKRMWVCVSEPFDRCRIAKDIIEQVDSSAVIPNSVEVLHQQLSKCLQGKKYLLVLDDVWTEERALWEPVKVSLDSGALGSRILVTTRNQKVADTMGSSPSHTHKLEGLSDEESWSVISHVALKGREEKAQKFEKIGKQIAIKCKGVPLTIRILAGLLYGKREIGGWRDVVDRELWELAGVQDTISSSLLMSFISLPSISKLCFMYCAVFPKDTKMEKDALIKLWMAQGFLGNNRTEKLEEIGGDHFDILAMRSFFQDFEEDSRGRILSCKMHDLVHDFAQSLRQGECYNLEESNAREFDLNKVRYLWTSDLEKPSIFDAKSLRTLIAGWNSQRTVAIQVFNSLSCLRALDLGQSYVRLESLPKEVDKLLHLRYLNLSGTEVEELPETICNLYNLQTLDLSKCTSLRELPDRIGDLSNLRHLNIEGTDELSYLPHGIKRLGFLRTLSKFIVGGPNKISDLQELNHLQGSLDIIGLERVRDANEASQASLKKKKLCAFTFKFGLLEGDDVRKMMETVLEKLEPHEDFLERLFIEGYPGYRFPNWMHKLGNIVGMELIECPNCPELPCLGRLPCLENLQIWQMDSVKHIGNKFYWSGVGSSSSAQMTAFPKLKKLVIMWMENLEEWELPISNNMKKIMPCLSELRLYDCPKLSALPGLGRLESLEILNLNSLPSVKCVGLEFLGISRDVADEDGYSSVQDKVVSFPKLKELRIGYMENLERWIVPSSFQRDASVMIMPHLRILEIACCRGLRELPDMSLYDLPKSEGPPEEEEIVEKEKDDGGNLRSLRILDCTSLTVVPRSVFSPTLRRLGIRNCPRLGPEQPCLPSLLEELELYGDAGIFSKSLPLSNDPGGHQHIINLRIIDSPNSSLPEGFNQLKALQNFQLWNCEHLDFQLEELQQFTMLQKLSIVECPLLAKRFQGEQWRCITSHVPNINLDKYEIKKSN